MSAPADANAGACPLCAKPPSAQHKPFCSKRCADIDLGRWLKGGYAIPGAPAPEPGKIPPDDPDDA